MNVFDRIDYYTTIIGSESNPIGSAKLSHAFQENNTIRILITGDHSCNVKVDVLSINNTVV
jgi:hypothetical protein